MAEGVESVFGFGDRLAPRRASRYPRPSLWRTAMVPRSGGRGSGGSRRCRRRSGIRARVCLPGTRLPLAERIDRHQGEGNVAIACLALRLADCPPLVRTLPDVDHCVVEIDVPPGQAAQLAGAHPGEDRGDDQGPPPARRLVEDRPQLVPIRGIHASTDGRNVPLVVAPDLDTVATFWATLPLPWQNVSMVLRLVSTLRRIDSDRPAFRSLSSNSYTRGP